MLSSSIVVAYGGGEDADPQLSPEEIAALAALELEDNHDLNTAAAHGRVRDDVLAYEVKMSQWWNIDRQRMQSEMRNAPVTSVGNNRRGAPAETEEEILRRFEEESDDDDDDGRSGKVVDSDNESGAEETDPAGGSEEVLDRSSVVAEGDQQPPHVVQHATPKKANSNGKKAPATAAAAAKSANNKVSSGRGKTASPSRQPRKSSKKPSKPSLAITPVNVGATTSSASAQQRYYSHSKPLRADFSHQRGGGASSSSGSGVGGGPTKAAPPCSLHDIVRAVLPPELRVGGTDAIADGLSQVKIAELQDMNLTDSGLLELLGNLTNLYAQHNALTELAGLALCPKLSVVVVHHNQLTSLQDLHELDKVAIVDASFNRIAELDPLRHLPTATLQSLNLRGNPCCPTYDDNDPEDVAYVQEYRKAILSVCEKMSMLDGIPVTVDMRVSLGLDDTLRSGGGGGAGSEPSLLAELARSDHESIALDAQLERQAGLQTTVTDEDFLIGSGSGGGRTSPTAAQPGIDREHALRRNPLLDNDGDGLDDLIATGGGGAHDHHSSEEEESGGGRPPRVKPKSQSLSPNNNLGTSTQQQQHLTITDRLLRQYQTQSTHHRALVEDAVVFSSALVDEVMQDRSAREASSSRQSSSRAVQHDLDGRRRFDPERRDDDDDDDEGDAHDASRTQAMNKLADVTQGQMRLRSELRMAMLHHSEVAQVKLEDHWHGATEKLRERQQRALLRRLEMKERLSRPSAAYTAALETLAKESSLADKPNTHALGLPLNPPSSSSNSNDGVVAQHDQQDGAFQALDRYRKDTSAFAAELKKAQLLQQQASAAAGAAA
jgi:Leucine-rich repeat (LRR) protein